jgi:hypothetical protein
MQLLNYFRKFLTGYYTESKKIKGFTFRYSYSGKPVLFDPFTMLEQYRQRSGQESIQRIQLTRALSDPFPDFAYPDDGDLPSVICQGVKDGHEFRTEIYIQRRDLFSQFLPI